MRDRPPNAYAAAVPIAVAQNMAPVAIFALSHRASVQLGSAKNDVYQCVVKPGGGNCRNGLLLNDNGTTTSMGATKKRHMVTAKATRIARLSIGPNLKTLRRAIKDNEARQSHTQ